MRRFGLEVEFGGSMRAAASALSAAGLGDGQVYSYSGQARHGLWTIKSDGSVSSGGEMVSPILDFDDPDSRGQVDRAIAALKAAGCTTDDRAGIHVHVDGTNLTVEQVTSVARCFAKFEDVIYRIASSGWRSIRHGARQYARPIPHERTQAIARARTLSGLGAAWYACSEDQIDYYTRQHGHASRYAGLNLHSWFYRKTIEFRVFNSSLNAERVQGYIAMCVAMVEDARRGNKRSINKRYELGGMASGTTNEANAFHRFQQVMRYEAGMSLEDMKRLTRIWKDSVAQSNFAGSIY
jgi:hypothetical protein